ncbi:hypothetical protein [Pseudothauera rhizosphaerae]|uniref:Uncharacterized protein n=1 Tax=Pseudothauera rhizosphaerae TaxID=2565932 RepID=A0A4S4A8M9_9RHOO|nr:hypothetical protein [Pseudothauera rhizosphaerae]THF55149.1 hypothetical protein E6O51_21145 [Pseudothauera rhizosphaerae]
MSKQTTLLEHIATACATRLPLPGYRQVELYTKRRKLFFAQGEEGRPGLERLQLALAAFHQLEDHFAAADPSLFEGRSTWRRYLDLPRRNVIDKVAAELYRILRIVRIAALHRGGRCEAREGLLRLSCDFERCALDLNITPAGIDLLAGAVAVFLDSFRQPYPEAYTEALLAQYYVDIVAEVRKFGDEDRVLFQFRPPFEFFNRHFRFDCDNPKVAADADRLRIEVGRLYRDPVRFPIDFYLPLDDALFIVPVEALKDFTIDTAALARWRARLPDARLPAAFEMRFSREEMVVGLPMT